MALEGLTIFLYLWHTSALLLAQDTLLPLKIHLAEIITTDGQVQSNQIKLNQIKSSSCYLHLMEIMDICGLGAVGGDGVRGSDADFECIAVLQGHKAGMMIRLPCLLYMTTPFESG